MKTSLLLLIITILLVSCNMQSKKADKTPEQKVIKKLKQLPEMRSLLSNQLIHNWRPISKTF